MNTSWVLITYYLMASVNILPSLFPLDTFICFIFFQAKAIFIPFFAHSLQSGFIQDCAIWQTTCTNHIFESHQGLDMQVYSALLLFLFFNSILFIFSCDDKSTNNILFGH